MNPQDTELQQQLADRLAQLPAVVRQSIGSADIEKRLQTLADTNKLHFDQWQIFENEVMLALLGIQKVQDLEAHISQHVGINADIAHKLAAEVNAAIFEPIRQKIEQELEHPEAKEDLVTSAEAARTQILAAARAEEGTSTATPAIQPATPPAPPPQVKIVRPSGSSAYKPGEASHERASIHDDPYRESPV